MAPLASRATPMAGELASTQMVNSFPSTYQSPRPSHSSHGFGQHTSQSSISHFIVPSWRHRGCTSFYSHHRHSELAAYGKVTHQFSIHRKGAPVRWQVEPSERHRLSSNKVSLRCCWCVVLALSPHFGEALALCISTWNAQNVFWPPGKTQYVH